MLPILILMKTGNVDEDNAVACKIKYLASQINHLKEEVESKKLDSRKVLWKRPEELLDFPRLDEEELRNITCGTYQLKLSPSYAEEHFNDGADIMVHRDDPYLLRVKIQSRHVSSKSYLLWIRYNETSVTGWYCKCRAWSRLVVVCGHIASGRHQESIHSVREWGRYIDDASVIPKPVGASESEEEGVEE